MCEIVRLSTKLLIAYIEIHVGQGEYDVPNLFYVFDQI